MKKWDRVVVLLSPFRIHLLEEQLREQDHGAAQRRVDEQRRRRDLRERAERAERDKRLALERLTVK